jgi:hypothetical protein
MSLYLPQKGREELVLVRTSSPSSGGRAVCEDYTVKISSWSHTSSLSYKIMAPAGTCAPGAYHVPARRWPRPSVCAVRRRAHMRAGAHHGVFTHEWRIPQRRAFLHHGALA